MTAAARLPLEALPPASVQAEQAVLGAIMIDPSALLVVGEKLAPEDFHRVAHQLIYRALLDMRGRGVEPDIVTVTDELESRKQLATKADDKLPTVSYLHSLATVVPTAVHALHYAAIVKEAAQLRRLIDIGRHMVADAYSQERDSDELIAACAGKLRDLMDKAIQRGGLIRDIQVPEELKLRPIPAKHQDISNALRGGFRQGVSYVVAAPPGGLKTSFLIDAELHAALLGFGIVHITNELPAWIMKERYLAALGKYHLGRALDNTLYAPELDARETAELTINQMPIYLYESVPTVDEIGLRLARAKAEHSNVKMLVVDYIQRVRGDARTERHQVVSENFDKLQEIARNEGVALLLASSLPKGDWDSDPDSWGGRESGDIKGYTSVFMALRRKRDDDAQTPGHLNLALHITKNTLGAERTTDFQVCSGSQDWHEPGLCPNTQIRRRPGDLARGDDDD